jgi:hypothetical protein
MAMATMVAGKQMEAARKRAMATKTREVGEEEGNGKGGKSNGNGKEEGNGKEDGMESVFMDGLGERWPRSEVVGPKFL